MTTAPMEILPAFTIGKHKDEGVRYRVHQELIMSVKI